MFSRQDLIDDAKDGTFTWIIMPDSDYQACTCICWLFLPPEYEAEGLVGDCLETRHQQHQHLPSDRLSLISDLETYSHLSENQSNDESRRLLRQWLTDGGGVLHISGKAGSGKSTLVKTILNDSHTVSCLERWAGNKALVVASCFFLRSNGQSLQLSPDGLYRSILFEVLRKCSRFIPDVFPGQWRAISSKPESTSFESGLFRPREIKLASRDL